MENQDQFDVAVIGGSYAGLSAAMALGRSLRKTLIIDSGMPCNRQTPHSHNFITQDGEPPHRIAQKARAQVLEYPTVTFTEGKVTEVSRENNGFRVALSEGSAYSVRKVLFATGIRDLMPDLPGFEECWGISLIHCPYCHGYEVRHKKTGILANGERAFEFCTFIRNWTDDLTLFTNGEALLSAEQKALLHEMGIPVVEKEITGLTHQQGTLKHINFTDGSTAELCALYYHAGFEQHCKIPEALGCAMTEQGHIEVDFFGKTSVPGIFAAGDNTTPMRTVSVAVAAGTKAGAFINRELIDEGLKALQDSL